jgi:DNA mismatch repair protein MutL
VWTSTYTPTKQEVKFEDDRIMYAYLHAAVKHALARYNIAPSLDFSLNPEVTRLPSVNLPVTEKEVERTQHGYLYQTFTRQHQAHFIDRKDGLQRWKDLYEIAQQTPAPPSPAPPSDGGAQHTGMFVDAETEETADSHNVLMVQGAMLVTTVRSGLMVIHIRRAQERIWYERLQQQWEQGNTPAQQLLFPFSYELPPQDCVLLNELLPDLARIGFDIAPFGKNAFVVQGVPSGLPGGEEKQILDDALDQLRHESHDALGGRAHRLLVQLARRLSRSRQPLQHAEGQRLLIDELFGCTQPEYTPEGKRVFVIVRKEELDSMLE